VKPAEEAVTFPGSVPKSKLEGNAASLQATTDETINAPNARRQVFEVFGEFMGLGCLIGIGWVILSYS